MSTSGTPQSDNEQRKLQIEEYKELGHEYRYRDQMMVQEFGLSMVAIGVIAARLWTEAASWKVVVVQGIVVLFVFILAFHLDHINQDRCAALDRREKLREALGFASFHLGAGGRRVSAPRMMIWFARLLFAVWVIWVAVSVYQLSCPQ